jgi:enoyl-CoA hydratase/carnithine racemase
MGRRRSRCSSKPAARFYGSRSIGRSGRNAINAEVIGTIADAIRGAPARDGIRAIVLTGAGDRAFCAGGDLAPNAEGVPFVVDPAQPRNYVVDLLKTMEDCDLPIVARVNGHALAGGLGLLCACDLAVASSAATFGRPRRRSVCSP